MLWLRRTIIALLVSSAAIIWAPKAEAAIEIWTSDDGLQMVELSPSLKLFFFGAGGFLESPDGYDELGLGPWLYPNVGGGMLGRLRIRFLADIHRRIRFVVHYEHRPRVLSHGRILSAASSSLQGDEGVPFRITPLQWTITESRSGEDSTGELFGDQVGDAASTFAWEHEIDRLFFTFALPRIDITVGRQAIGWGTGRLWSPMDVFAPLTATDIDREERRGIDAIRLTLPFSSTSLMEVVVAAGARTDEDGDLEPSWDESSIAWMMRINAFDIEWMLMAGKIGPAEVVGGAINGQIRGVALRGEITATTAPRTRYATHGSLFRLRDGDHEETNLRATVGIEFGTSIGLTGIIEYHYNGFGVLDTDEYMVRAQELSEDLGRGSVSGVAQHYAGVTLAWQPLSVLSVSLFYIQNLQDGSLAIGPALEYSISDEVRLALSGLIPLGRDARWDLTDLENPLQARSEFGLGSQLYVLQLRANI